MTGQIWLVGIDQKRVIEDILKPYSDNLHFIGPEEVLRITELGECAGIIIDIETVNRLRLLHLSKLVYYLG